MSFGQKLAGRLLGWFGWRVRFAGLPGARGVIVVYPHTSNWDFVVGICAKWTMGFDACWIGKHSLFWWPMSLLMRRLGGIAVRRDRSSGTTAQLVERMRASERMWLAVTPEGTRSLRPAWKSGFYHLALAAGVPVGLAYLDYGSRCVGLTEFITLSGDVEADMARIAAYYAGMRGKRPQFATPPRFAGE